MRARGRFLIVLVLAVTLVACGGSSSGSSKDTTAPVITLTGANPQTIEAGTAYVELGATASDVRDGGLSNSIVIDAGAVDTQVPGSYVVTYTVTDAAGNKGTATRTVVIEDTTPPVITLLGDDPQVIVAGNPYSELGATATDTLDGDLSAQIVIDATAVDTMVAGDYTVTYDVTDAAGNAAVTAARTVRVVLPPPPAAPQVSVEGDIKQLIFNWDEVVSADHYRLMENADGHSGFTQVGDDIPVGTLSATRDIAVHLHDWVNALYLVQACNLGGCTGSTQVSNADVMLDTIGYFKASDTTAEDFIGRSVSLSADGSTLVIGGIRGAYVFRNDENGWYRQAFITGSNSEAGDSFASWISIDAAGNTVAIGAAGEDSNATGINGNQADNSASSAGAVYVFSFEEAGWIQQAYIKASNTEAGDRFGARLALSADGGTLAISAPMEDSRATGINGDQYDDDGRTCYGDSGAVFVFRFDGTDWYQQAYVKASNTGIGAVERYDPVLTCFEGDYFGEGVALSADGDTLAVGALFESGFSAGVNGDQSNGFDVANNTGAAYVFTFDQGSWSQQAYIKPSAASGGWYLFGARVALDGTGTVLAVSAPGDSNSAAPVNEPPVILNGLIQESGALYLLRFDGETWFHDAYFKASNAEEGDELGVNVALSADGNILAAASIGEDSSALGVGGDSFDNSADGAGAVYVFRFDGAAWLDPAYVKASNTEAQDLFGVGAGLNFSKALTLSADGTTMAIGAPGEDSGATGTSGDQSDNSAEQSGAVYVY
jgi:hypothetical protein